MQNNPTPKRACDTYTNARGSVMATEMVEAIIAKRKHTTRRITKDLATINENPSYYEVQEQNLQEGTCTLINIFTAETIKLESPMGVAGDVRYIREAYRPIGWQFGQYYLLEYKDGNRMEIDYLFEEDGKDDTFLQKLSDELLAKKCPMDSAEEYFVGVNEHIGWKMGRFMPKRAARIWVRQTRLYLQQMNWMTDADYRKEGLMMGQDKPKLCVQWHNLMSRLHPDYNPKHFAWVTDFEVICTDGMVGVGN